MMTKEKWKLAEEGDVVRVLRSPKLVRFSGWLVRFLLGAILSGVELAGGYSPLGIAFVGASGSGVEGGFALLGALFGTLYFWGFSKGLRDMAAVVLVYSVAFAFFDTKAYGKIWFMPAVTGAMVAMTGFLSLPARLSPAATAYYISAVLLAGGAAYFDRCALGARNLFREGEQTRRDRISLLLMGGTLLMALARVTAFNGLSVGRVLSALVVLGAAGLGGGGAGASVGIGTGFAMDLASGERLYAVAFGYSGLISGLFRKHGRWVTTMAFVLADGMMALWMWERAQGCENLLYEVFVAAVIFVTLPERIFRRLQLLAAGQGDGGWDYRRARVKERLEQTAGAFRTVYENLRESFSQNREMGEEPPFRIFDRAARKVCLRCVLRDRCWQEEYQATAGALNDGLCAMLERGTGMAGDFPEWFAGRCIHFPAFLEAANEELAALLYRRRYQLRLQESRAAVCRQYGELYQVLEGAALELSRELVPEPVRERRLGRWLAGQEIEGEWSVFYDDRGHLRAEIVSREGERLCNEESRAALSQLFHLPLRGPQVKIERGRTRVIYTQAEPLAAVAGVAAKKRDGEVVSGDSGSWFKGEDGILWLMLCDGMGSGAEAGKESGTAIRLLETFLRAGVPAGDTLRILNEALALRGEGSGSFTTVDLCRVDLFTGAGTVYKLGAAPTYVKKGDTVVRITGTALPAGATAGSRIEPDATPFRLEAGDCILLVTDGVTDGEEDEWLRQILREFDGVSPKELARRILEEGIGRAASPDDRTVLVVQVGKR